jgi:hypothetical protein
VSDRASCPIAGGRHIVITVHSGYIAMCASDVGDSLWMGEAHARNLIRCLAAALKAHQRVMAAAEQDSRDLRPGTIAS